MVAIATPEQVNRKISYDIAHPIDQFAARKTNSETTAHDFSILQRSRDFFQTTARHLAISMKKPEHIAAGDTGAGIHLRSATPPACQGAIAQLGHRPR